MEVGNNSFNNRRTSDHPWSDVQTNENGKNTENMYQMTVQFQEPIKPINGSEKIPEEEKSSGGEHTQRVSIKHPTSYLETWMNFIKANTGTGMFAMGDAIKNGGILLGPVLVLFIGSMCLHCNHLLLGTAEKMRSRSPVPVIPDFAETVEMVFATGSPKFQKMAKLMKRLVNIFLCITQLGFCCVYFLFISENVKQIFDEYKYKLDIHYHLAIVLLPILLTALVRNLKYLTPFSTIANVLMLVGIIITIYYCVSGLPSIKERDYVASYSQLPLFFGTAVFAFEGIGLLLPLQNEMKNPSSFSRPMGVLNVGMCIVVSMYTLMGFLSYLRYGSDVKGSVTLNFNNDEKLAQAVKIIICLAILLSYSLEFYIPVSIMWPAVRKTLRANKYPVFFELIFRTFLVLITFVLAEAVPYLHLFISLVGAISCSALVLIFPTVIDLVYCYSHGGMTFKTIVIDSVIICFGILGSIVGTYQSLRSIIEAF